MTLNIGRHKSSTPSPYSGNGDLHSPRFPYGSPPNPQRAPVSQSFQAILNPIRPSNSITHQPKRYEGYECSDSGAFVLNEDFWSKEKSARNRPFLSTWVDGIDGQGPGVGRDPDPVVPSEKRLTLSRFRGSTKASRVPAPSQLAKHHAPRAGLKDNLVPKIAQAPDNDFSSRRSTKDQSTPARDEPPHVTHELAKPVNNKPRQEQKPPKTDRNHNGQRWCGYCDEWKPSSQFYQKQHGRNSEFTKACLDCRNLEAERMRDLVPAVQACPQCRKSRPGTDFLDAIDPEEENASAILKGPYKRCWGCRLLRAAWWCRECTKVLTKADKIMIATSDERQLLCRNCSWEIVTKPGRQTPPSPKISPVRLGINGSSHDLVNGHGSASPAPRGSGNATDNSSTRKKRQLSPSPTQNPNTVKRTKLTVAHADTLGHEANAATGPVTATNPDAVYSTGSGGTSKLNQLVLAAPAPPTLPAVPAGNIASSTDTVVMRNTGATTISDPTAVPVIESKVQGISLGASMHIPESGFNAHRGDVLVKKVKGQPWGAARKPTPTLHHSFTKAIDSALPRVRYFRTVGIRFAEMILQNR